MRGQSEPANLGLLRPDLDYHEKQLWGGVLRLVGLDSNGNVNSDIFEKLGNSVEYAGTVMYFRALRKFVQIFIGSRPVEESLPWRDTPSRFYSCGASASVPPTERH